MSTVQCYLKENITIHFFLFYEMQKWLLTLLECFCKEQYAFDQFYLHLLRTKSYLQLLILFRHTGDLFLHRIDLRMTQLYLYSLMILNKILRFLSIIEMLNKLKFHMQSPLHPNFILLKYTFVRYLFCLKLINIFRY